jgi:hypothetical protein
LAQKGKGKKVRFQGGTVFPTVMGVVLMLGIGLVAFSRQSAPSKNDAPTVNDHWHVAYGFYRCADPTNKSSKAEFMPNLVGTLEEPVDPNFTKYGIHSHGDGVIHWHPRALASGKRAKLGLFFDSYGVKVTKDEITFNATQSAMTSLSVDKVKCADKNGNAVDAQVKVVVWDQYDDATKSTSYITDFGNIRIKKDGMAVTVAFIAPGDEIPLPPTASNLPELGSADSSGATTTTVAGQTSSTVASTTTGG